MHDLTTLAEASRTSAQLAKRQMETLALYEPLPHQERFHASTKPECIMVKGNRTGGSACAFVELVRACCGLDPYKKYPKRGGTAIVVGYGEDHIARNIHRYLLEPGAFKLIQDEETGRWRSYRRWEDEHRKDQAIEAPPLIPERYIKGGDYAGKGVIYTKRNQKIISRIDFTTGWTLWIENSASDPKHAQGFAVNLVMFDEDLDHPDWYEEMHGRALDEGGLIRWNALPHEKNMAIHNLIRRGEEGDPHVDLIRVTTFENPHLNPESLAVRVAAWKAEGEEVYRKRVLGQTTTASLLVYPTFDTSLHGIDPWQLPGGDQERRKPGDIPDKWSRFLVIDPGVDPCTVLFAAVPPPGTPGWEDAIVLYDEISFQNYEGAEGLADQVEPKLMGKQFQAFIIDDHGSRRTEESTGFKPRSQYSEAFARRNMTSDETGSDFYSGSDEVQGRVLLVQGLLSKRSDGTPRLRYVRGQVKQLELEHPKYRKKQVLVMGKRITTNDPDPRGIHQWINVEYLAAHDPEWKPHKPSRREGRGMRRLREKLMSAAGFSGGYKYQ